MGRKSWEEWLLKRVEAIWTNLQTNHLWQRMFKNTTAVTIVIIIGIIPAVVNIYGKAAYLGVLATVFGHPGRRFGVMAQDVVLATAGTLVGLGWSIFGIYLSSFVYNDNIPAAATVKAIFALVTFLVHGFLRSHTPRLYLFVLLLVIASTVNLVSAATAVSKTAFTGVAYPLLTALAVNLVVNVTIFPEFSSSFLGISTIETLGESVAALRDAGHYFIASVGGQESVESAGTSTGEIDLRETRSFTAAEKPLPQRESAGSFWQGLAQIFRANKKGEAPKIVKLKALTNRKAQLRAKLDSCKAAQLECNFELAFSVLPPRNLKPISNDYMKKLVANTIALIGACESKYALMGDDQDVKTQEGAQNTQPSEDVDSADSRTGTDAENDSPVEGKRKSRKERRLEKARRKKMKQKLRTSDEIDMADLILVKPRKEIESADIELLRYLVDRIKGPLADLQHKIDGSVNVVSTCLAFCYEVPRLPSGLRAPAGIRLDEIDIRVDILADALAKFDRDSTAALESSAAAHHLDLPQVDVMPRMETFLISSFLLNLRQAASHMLEMLRYSRTLVEEYEQRHRRRTIHLPHINWQKWLATGGEIDQLALPDNARKDARSGNAKSDEANESKSSSKETLVNEEVGVSTPRGISSQGHRSSQKSKARKKKSRKGTLILRLRNRLADTIEYMVGSDDVLYAIKIAVAMFLVTWPAFVHAWTAWYSLNRGIWAALQLITVSEVAIGTSVRTFTLRGIGTMIGCVWGYAAYSAMPGNKPLCVFLLVIGIIPSTYVQLGSQYVKAGMVSIISMGVVALAILDATVVEAPSITLAKRMAAFLIGGVIAILVQVVLFPVKARDRLVESLASSIRRLSEMEACLAYGIESESNVDVHSAEVSTRFARAKGKAEGALSAASTFLPFCSNEPRLKGSFSGVAPIYEEILYVLHSIVDRMDNMLALRQEYGSGVLEELNAQVYAYRRNVAGSITLLLFAVHEALTTKLPLPQFLPSARLAHLRMVNRVREVVMTSGSMRANHDSDRSELEMNMVMKRIIRHKFLSWNAASAGQIEVIEYLEELIDLVKLLVGANEFRSGLLTRPSYREYAQRMKQTGESAAVAAAHNGEDEDEMRDQMPDPIREEKRLEFKKKRTMSFGKNEEKRKEEERARIEREEQLPRSLQRIRSRTLTVAKTQSRENLRTVKGKATKVD